MKYEEVIKRGEKIEKRGKEIDQLIADRHKPGELVKERLGKCGDDLILITLKGHLILENLLEMNLCRLLKIDRLPERGDAELTFKQKLKLVQSVVEQREPGPNADSRGRQAASYVV